MRYTKIVAPAVAVLLLAGCSGNPKADYLSEVRQKVVAAQQADDDVLLSIGNMVCAQLRLDATRFQVVTILTTEDTGFLTEPETAAIVNAAGDHLCPGEGKK
jgi:uncharacterized lipoprotein YajG